MAENEGFRNPVLPNLFCYLTSFVITLRLPLPLQSPVLLQIESNKNTHPDRSCSHSLIVGSAAVLPFVLLILECSNKTSYS
jgi:hypothetical protein